MRIAVIGDTLDFQYAGVKVYLEGLLMALSRHQERHEFFLIRSNEKNEFDGIREIIIPVKPWLPMHRRLRYFFEIPAILKKLKIEAIIEPAHFGPFRLLPSIKRINIVHDLTPVLFPQYHPRFSQIYHRFFFPGILKKADLIIVNSENTKRDLIEWLQFTKSKILKLYPSAPPIFQPTKNSGVLKKHGIRVPYILSVATLEPRKNLNCLLRAFEIIKKEKKLHHQLVLVGKKGWGNRGFEALLESTSLKDEIVLTGFVPESDLPALYSQCAAFVYPSFYEGFGLPVLEAMTCGAPAVISDTSSLPEVGGEAALYFDPKQETDLVQQLIKLLTDDSELEKRKALSMQNSSKFSWEKSVENLMTNLTNHQSQISNH